MEEIMFLRIAAVIAAGGAAAYFDYKTGYIYDKITYPLIGAGIILNIYEQQYLGIAIAAIMFVGGWLLYKTGKIGGGDVKLYAGIAAMLPFYHGAPFIVPVLLFSALTGVVFISAYYSIKYARRGIDFELNKSGILRAIMLLSAVLIYFIAASSMLKGAQAFIYAVSIPLIAGCVFIALEKGIRKEFFLKKIKPRESEDDEVIALDFMESSGQKLPGLKPVMSRSEILGLEKTGIREILVYRNLPKFGPFILAGIIIALIMLGTFPQLFVFSLPVFI